MKKLLGLFALAVIVSAVAMSGCSDSGESPVAPALYQFPVSTMDLNAPCGDPLVVDLLAGQYIDVGQVTVQNDEEYLRIIIDTGESGWVMTETHVAVAPTLDELPMTGSGNPQVGKFEFKSEYDPPVTYWIYDINLAEYGYGPDQEIFIAVHAAVELPGEGDEPIQEETAWAEGLEFPGNSWATYFLYTVQSCFVPSCELAVTAPADGAFYCEWDPVDIFWDATFCGDTVRIELLLNGELCSVLAVDAPNTGSYLWWAVRCTESFEGYSIRVTDTESGAYDDSDGAFIISDCGGGGGGE